MLFHQETESERLDRLKTQLALSEAALEAVDNALCAALAVIDGVFEDLDRYADGVIVEMEESRK